MDAHQRAAISLLYLRDKHPFPRGAMRQYPVMSRRGGQVGEESIPDLGALEAFCKWNKDVYVNLFSDDQRTSKMYDMIFIDIDDADPELSYMRFQMVIDALRREHISVFNVMWSGSKGYHIYVPFKPTLLSSYRDAVMGWVKSIGIGDLVDQRVVEPNRVTRVPYSKNTKSGLYCIPLPPDDFGKGTAHFGAMAKSSSVRLQFNSGQNDIGAELRSYDKEAREYGEASSYHIGTKSQMFTSFDHYPECMKLLASEAKKGTDLGHYERLELGKFLLSVTGGDVDEVERYYGKMSDYSSSTTRYQLNYIMERGLYLNRCDNLMDMGICPFKRDEAPRKCPFYPTINAFIREDGHA